MKRSFFGIFLSTVLFLTVTLLAFTGCDTTMQAQKPPKDEIATVVDKVAPPWKETVATTVILTPANDEYIQNLPANMQLDLYEISQMLYDDEILMASSEDGFRDRWVEVLGNSGNIDVNALVQFVLREAYLQTAEDLRFYAEQVKFYNDLKRQIREELEQARNLSLFQYESDIDEDIIVYTADGMTFNGPNPYIKKNFITEPAFDEATGQWTYPRKAGTVTTKEDLETYIKNLEYELNSVGDDAQLANVDLQNMLQKQQQALQMMSNMSKMMHDTAMAIIRKIGS